MHTAKEIALVSVFTALLIGGQFVFSFVAGVEVVTVLLLCFCFTFGVKRGLLVATSFSALRCVIFGFFPAVAILYFIYYSIFVVVFGLVGHKFNSKGSLNSHVLVTALAVLLTCCFTLLDDVITTAFYRMGRDAATAYFYSSLPVMITQAICAFGTVLILFRPIVAVLGKVNFPVKKRLTTEYTTPN